MATFSGRKRTLRGRVLERRSFCSSPYVRSLRCEHLEDRRLLAQITVTTDQDIVDLDDGLTSLREAIFAANIVPGADEIVFDFGHDGPAKILLAQGELKITDAVTISGPGAELLTVDNSLTQGPIFDIDNFAIDTIIDVDVSGMTLTGSKDSAIRAVEDLTVEDMIFRSNRGSSGAGILMGAIGTQTQNIKLTVRNSRFEDNRTVSTTGFSSGGGISFFGRFGELRIENTSFVGNLSTNGGGVSIAGFSNLVNISDSHFVGNDAMRGGGIAIADDNSKVATLTRVEVRDNRASVFGGGVYITGKAVTIEESNIVGNRMTESTASSMNGGGGIYKQGGDPFIIRNSTVRENQSFTDGGGILLDRSGMQMSDSIVEQNTASRGGGISLQQAANVEIIRSTLSGNNAQSDGGGLFSRGTSTNIRLLDSTVSGNSAAGSGGGLSVTSGTFLLQNSTVSGNKAGSNGGGIDAPYATLQFQISQSRISGNSANESGGGIRAVRSVITISDSHITENNALWHGGGIDLSRASLNLQRSNVSGNSALKGGAVSAESCPQLFVAHSLLSGNASESIGGAIYALGVPKLEILNTTISGNRSFNNGASAILVGAGDASILHSTITNNFGKFPSAVSGQTITLSHTIVAGNYSELADGPEDISGKHSATHSLIGVGAEFLGPLADNGGPTMTHALLPGSPAINAGDPTLEAGVQGTPLFDQRGAPFARVAGGRIDIGAYESQPEGGLYSGDFDGDGDVDGRDFLAWQRGYGFQSAPPDRTTGDATGNGVVDGLDLIVWQEMYGTTSADLGLRIADSEESSTQRMASSLEGSLAVSPRENVSSDDPIPEERYVEPLDRVLEQWAPLKRSSIDFGDIVTHRPIKRRAPV